MRFTTPTCSVPLPTENVAHLRWSHILVYHSACDVRDLTMRWAAWLYKQQHLVPAEFHEALLPLLCN